MFSKAFKLIFYCVYDAHMRAGLYYPKGVPKNYNRDCMIVALHHTLNLVPDAIRVKLAQLGLKLS